MHGQCDFTSPLDGTLAQTYSLSHHLIGMNDRYSAETTGANQNLHDRHTSAKKIARSILCFDVGTGKSVCIVLSSSPLQSSMALARGLRGSRKSLLMPAPDVFVMKQPPLSAQLPPCTSEPN